MRIFKFDRLVILGVVGLLVTLFNFSAHANKLNTAEAHARKSALASQGKHVVTTVKEDQKRERVRTSGLKKLQTAAQETGKKARAAKVLLEGAHGENWERQEDQNAAAVSKAHREEKEAKKKAEAKAFKKSFDPRNWE